MVLEGFGSGLKGAFKRIAGIGSVDKAAVEAVVREVQRTLLTSDVDVRLVSELSSRIKKRVLDDRPPAGMTLKEHFIKTLYDELVAFLGSEPGEVEIKKQRILVCGLFGSGKCVNPEALIPISDGRIMEIQDIYSEYESVMDPEKESDGHKIDISKENLLLPSFNPNTLKIDTKKATHIWKLKGKSLLKVSLDNGNDFNVNVTPEHPFFVLRDGHVQKISATNLMPGDSVAVPRSYEFHEKEVDLFPKLKELNLDVFTSSDAAKQVIKKYKNLIEACKSSKFSRNYCKFTTNIKNGRIPICFLGNNSDPVLHLKLFKGVKPIHFPRYLTRDLAEFIGYIIGDGHVERRYLEVSTEAEEIIERLIYLSKSLFGLEPEIRTDERARRMFRIRLASTTLVGIFGSLFNLRAGEKGKALSVPDQILESDREIIRAFLRAYFDCDSSANACSREIELTSESKILLNQVGYLLNRFGIAYSLSKKMINNIPYWRLFIRARDAESYANKIGFLITEKTKRAARFSQMGLGQGCGKQDMIPLGQFIKTVRMSLGFSIGEIQEICNSYGRYEARGLISRESLAKVVNLYYKKGQGIHAKILKSILVGENLVKKYAMPITNSAIAYYKSQGIVIENDKKLLLADKGLMFLRGLTNKEDSIKYLEKLATADVIWCRVRGIEKTDAPEFVYDFTVEDNHSFIADGIIVHNTTTIGKMAKWFKTRGLSVGVVAGDTHRPAAQTQLQQLADNIGVPCYKDGGKPEDIAKKALTAKEDVLIFDTAGRDALDRELARELKEMGEIIKPEEVLLVLPADIGQAARRQAEEFNRLVGITGIVVTKLDGTAKGGGALAAASVSGAKVKFIGVGEKPQDLEIYDPKRFVSKLIGYGDLQGLIEKAKQAGIGDSAKKIVEGKYTLNEFYEQIQSMQSMGSLSKITEMMPGLGNVKLPKGMLDVQEGKMKKWGFIIQSMTSHEKENPDDIKSTRITRIAKGSGTSEGEVRDLLKHYKQSKKIMKLAGGGKGLRRGPLAKLAKQFGMSG